MRKPYGRIFIISIVLTALFFWMEDRPAYITLREDMENILFFGALYVALIFCTLSGIYLYFKKGH